MQTFQKIDPLAMTSVRGKHCRKPHCRNGIVDTFGLFQKICQPIAHVGGIASLTSTTGETVAWHGATQSEQRS